MIQGHAGGSNQHEVQSRSQSQVEMNAPDDAQGSAAETHFVTIMKLKMNFIFKIGIYSLIWRLRPVKAFTAREWRSAGVPPATMGRARLSVQQRPWCRRGRRR